MNIASYLKNTVFSESDGSREQNLGGSIRIEKATSIDFERVYPLLLEFNNTKISRDKWRRIFDTNWNSPENYCGFLLLQGDRVEGYLGLLFSTRMIKGRVEKFCNITSWIVHKNYRSQSLRMLLELLKLTDYTITAFTPSEKVKVILQQLGFMKIETNQRILYPFLGTSFSNFRYRSIFDLEEISQKLNPADRAILFDHRKFDCHHVLLTGTDDYCYLVLKKRIYRHLPFARVHYISSPDFLLRAIELVRTRICWQLKVLGLIVDERYLGGKTIRCSRAYPWQYYFKSKTLGQVDIDTLYSELIILLDW
jgi:hypothetical protein